MLAIVLAAAVSPTHLPPVHDCNALWRRASRGHTVTSCGASLQDAKGVRRAVGITVQQVDPRFRPELGVHWWGEPDTTTRVWHRGHAATEQRWLYEGGARLTRSIDTQRGVWAVTVDVLSNDHASAALLAAEVAEGTRFAPVDGELAPRDTTTTWVDLPTNDCGAVPLRLASGEVGVRCEAVFFEHEMVHLVTYEVAQTFAPGRTVSVDDLAGADAMSAVTVHQGHPAVDRLWRDAGGTHRVRVVERDGVYVTLTATVHAHGDDDARALAERIVDAVDVRILR